MMMTRFVLRIYGIGSGLSMPQPLPTNHRLGQTGKQHVTMAIGAVETKTSADGDNSDGFRDFPKSVSKIYL